MSYNVPSNDSVDFELESSYSVPGNDSTDLSLGVEEESAGGQSLGTIRLQTPDGPKSVPVFEPSDVEYPIFRVYTPDGVGVLNLVDPSEAELDQLRIHTESYGTLAVSTSIQQFGLFMETAFTLNGASVTVTIYEDIDLDGHAENSEVVNLQSGTSSYSLENIQFNSGQYWIDVETENSVTDSPEIEYIEIVRSSSDLTVDATLNGGSITLTIYEDTDGDGEAENTEVIDVGDGSNTYQLGNLDQSSGNEYWLEIEKTDTDVTNSPSINSVEIQSA